MRKLFFITHIFAHCISARAQQAWTKQKGEYYSQLGITIYMYDGVVASDNSLIPLNRKLIQNSVQAYLEYGVTDKFMLTGIIPFTLAKSTNTANVQPSGLSDGSLNALSNIQLAVTHNFYKNKGYVLSAKLNTSLPTATYKESTGLRSGEDAFALEPSLLTGYGHAKFFTSAEIGFGYRTNGYSSQTLAAFQIGKFFGKNKKLLIIFNTNLRLSNENGSYNDGRSTYTAFYLNDLSYLAPGFKFSYKITPNITGWANIRAGLRPSQNIGGNSTPFPGLSFAISYSSK
ncbi:MAG: hypothetical protein H7Z72_00670 [Bacteroidetes bacterium]|nr:hypothetical protein [Fibrella sp.]